MNAVAQAQGIDTSDSLGLRGDERRALRISQEHPVASLIIPAHNEGQQIVALLTQLEGEVSTGDVVIVVANGCRDNTAELARGFSYVTVLDLNEPSKIAALNAGDLQAADNFPRLYLDADITFAPGTVRNLIAALQVEEARVVAPLITIDLSNSSFLVKSYYFVVSRHPWIVKHAQTHLAGRRIYGANRLARQRFSQFPTVTNDDGFFDQCFSSEERQIVPHTMVFTQARRTSAEEVGRLVRVRRGNRELDHWFSVSGQRRPDRENVAPLVGSRIVRIMRMLATSGFVTRPSLLAPAYIVGWLIMKRRVARITQQTEAAGAGIAWAGK